MNKWLCFIRRHDIKSFRNLIIRQFDNSIRRFKRFFIQPWRMLNYTFKAKADLCHFHDPEFIFSGFILKLLGKKVAFLKLQLIYSSKLYE
jgi:hypothetical protein